MEDQSPKSAKLPAQADSWRKVVLENALDAVIAIDSDDLIVDWNHHAEIIFGFSKEEAIGKKMAELIIPEESREAHARGMKHFHRTGEGPILNQRIEVEALHRTGCVFPVELTVMPVRVEGSLIFYSFLRDISERKRSEQHIVQALQQAQSLQGRLDAIFRQVMVGVAQVDLTGRFELVNERFCQTLGRPMEEVLRLKMQDVTHPEDLPKNRKMFERLVTGGPGFTIEKRYLRPDGSTVWVNNSVSLIRDNDGRPERIVAISQEITEQRTAQEKLRHSEERLDLAEKAGRLGTFEWLTEEDRIIWTEELSLLYGRPMKDLPEELEGWISLVHPDDAPRLREVARSALENQSDVDLETRIRLPDGSYRWLLLRADVFRDPSGKASRVVGVAIDISDRKRIEEDRERILRNEQAARAEAEAQRTRLYSLFMQAPVAVTIYRGPDFVYEMVNPVYVKLIGQRDYLGKRLLDAVPEVADQPVLQVLKQAWSSGEPQYGNEFPIQLAQSDGSVHDGLYNFVFQPLFDGEGRVEGIFVLGYEVTEHVLARRKLEHVASDLQQAVRARDEFISICSHELKTPVTSMKLQFQIAERLLKKGDEKVFSQDQVKRRISTANRQLDRMAKLIEEMLDVSKIGEGGLQLNVEALDLGELAREVLDRFSEQFSLLGVPVEVDVPPVAVPVMGDRYRLEQVLSNLLTNAIKYGAGSTVAVSLVVDGAVARLSVSDRGIGIAKEKLPRVFDRFERAISSSNISGLGLGLYISRQIVEAHKGRIWAESELGKGSTFRVELPLSQDSPAS